MWVILFRTRSEVGSFFEKAEANLVEVGKVVVIGREGMIIGRM